MKIAIIGANGQLGNDLQKALVADHELIPLTHRDIEITHIEDVKSKLTDLQPDMVINTAAYHVVPQCEQFPGRAFEVNGTGTLNLARVCSDLGAGLLHYSTDYVFDGEKKAPYTEDDRPNPLNVYASTKLAGEYFALNYSEKSFVVRVSGIYGEVPCRAKGSNFITTMLKAAKEKPEVKVVNDEVLTPTPTYSIAKNTALLINTNAYGLYHMTCEGQTSWYEFARTIWETLDLKTPLHAISVNDMPLAVKRPFYSVLENGNLKKIGAASMPHWKEALVAFLRTLKA